MATTTSKGPQQTKAGDVTFYWAEHRLLGVLSPEDGLVTQSIAGQGKDLDPELAEKLKEQANWLGPAQQRISPADFLQVILLICREHKLEQLPHPAGIDVPISALKELDN